ncbi:hypothetical protein ACCT32_35780, partial [Rhizobium brockwellii]|uniref:hypothetical protein n=1 Tax=Rhizobium brockwellii TaxID=3019932 RepID=UPI003F9728D7
LERREGGAKLVSDIDLVPRKRKRTVLSRLLDQRRSLPKGGESSSEVALPGNKNWSQKIGKQAASRCRDIYPDVCVL